MAKQPKLIHVAVVYRKGESPTSYVSNRPMGDYSAFLGTSQAEVVLKAKQAAAQWTTKWVVYKVLVGTLTEEMKTKQDYTLVKLGDLK